MEKKASRITVSNPYPPSHRALRLTISTLPASCRRPDHHHAPPPAGALTIIMQDGNAALEVYSGSKQDAGDGAWVPVDPVKGALTINTGDMMVVWSNGRFKVRRDPCTGGYLNDAYYCLHH